MSSAPRTTRPNGFTLAELLTVMAVIAILFSITVGTIVGAKRRAAIGRAKAELALLSQALEDYKRFYGDYPETGPALLNSQTVTLAANGTSAGPGLTTVASILFNSLTGVYGPTGTRGGRLNGPILVDMSKFTVEGTLPATFGVASGSPPAKVAVNSAFLDPWGNRYLYFYHTPVAAGRTPVWSAPAFVLYSCGPDGKSSILPNAAGVFTGTQQTINDNADNIYADKLQ